ncbi:undecaprenyl-phosphate glucose phosphotransferase [Flavobacterium sp. GN10]|uniref:Undecaprenyl-phosphate glucose phosphotransferase n=1 Tax=Flavobacterium tagetis TaxID=2801336 RepID=A0ABS1KIX6_9FLAO|nr:undecaprenyl-phosphate glucose phosphotransferase [Flavobacterium tagetis]MBL0739313.1 undecaprenyl-phosphate glucose phosphotransferase [Flavobacterium tagetis]
MKILQKLSQYSFSRYYQILFILWDMILLNIAVFVSGLIKLKNYDELPVIESRTILLLGNLIWIGLLLYKNSYKIIRIETLESILSRTIKKVIIHASIVAVFVVFLEYSNISRLQLFCFYVIFFVLLMLSRFFLMRFLKYVRSEGYNFRNVVIVGANDKGERMRKILAKNLTYGYKFLGFFDQKENISGTTSDSVLGGFDDVQSYFTKVHVDEMYIALHIDNVNVINRLIDICEHHMVRIKFIPDFQLYTKSSRVEISFYENTPVLMSRREPLEYAVNRLLKKAFDICFSSLVILGLFPWLFPIVMIIIKLESPGPIFFKQDRSGRDNKAFSCFKFRSMTVNDSSDNKQAQKNDLRVTKFGAFMRKTSIDELPQFFNVFLGNMSVVGPRPHMLFHTQEYKELINNYLVRQYAKPGITGWAQVNGYRGETKELIDMENRVEYDIWYIENWSLLLDIKIIIKTVVNVFRGEKNAY